MRILVTGVHGQLSRCLMECAAERHGLQVIAIGRPTLDLEILGSAAEAIAAAKPDLVINAAAYTAVDQAEDEPDRARRINAEAAGEIAAAARALSARVVHISTDFVFDGEASQPYTEDAAANPLGVYGRTKLAGEEAVRSANPDHLIVRTAWLYSPFGRNFVATIMRTAQDRDTLAVVDDQHGSPTSAFDLAEGLLIAIDAWSKGGRVGLGETYHLAGSGSASWFDLARAVMDDCASLGLPHAEVRPIASADWPAKAARPVYSELDSGRFGRDFGHIPPHWRTSVRKVVERLA